MKKFTLFAIVFVLLMFPATASAEKMNTEEYVFVKQYEGADVGAIVYHNNYVISMPAFVRNVKLLYVDRQTGMCTVSSSIGKFHVHWTNLIFPVLDHANQ